MGAQAGRKDGTDERKQAVRHSAARDGHRGREKQAGGTWGLRDCVEEDELKDEEGRIQRDGTIHRVVAIANVMVLPAALHWLF